MDIFDNEVEIIEFFQNVDTSSVMLIPSESPECENLCMVIQDEELWKLWYNSSGKSDPPPDFYSDTHGYMMDVMRVDDHGYISPKGKTVNPTRERESDVARELKDNGVFDSFPNARLFSLVDTGLPTHEDHNYIYYRDNFIRTIETHKKKIPNYKSNHLNLKIVFFVFDEASQYMQLSKAPDNAKVGDVVQAFPHFGFGDKVFWNRSRILILII